MRRLVLLALAATAWPDGGFVSTQVPVVEIPDQQAILVWREGRERLVIDTAHTAGGDLAWIVPLPAPPRIEPVSPAVFRTIEVVTMPAVDGEPSDSWIPGVFFLLALAAMAAIPSRRALVAALPLFLLGLYSLVALLVPRSGGGEGLTVIARRQAGSYETATVSAIDADTLLRWLDDNGFQTAPGIRAGIEEYIRDGWVFSVARLTKGGPGGRAHPLSFEFETKEPVYPMRLTGTQERALSLRLFVLSDRRARCDGLTVESCYETHATEDPRRHWRDQGRIRPIGQPELLAIADGANVLTTLGGELAPAQMRSDLYPAFEAYEPRVPVLRSEDAARSEAASVATWAALALLLPCLLVARWIGGRKGGGHDPGARTARRATLVAWCVAATLGLLAGVADYATTDITKTRGDEDPGAFGLHSSHSRASAIVAATKDIETGRAAAAAFWERRRNPYDGGNVREEASPGNYGLELRDGKVVYVAYDTTGMPVW